MYANNPKQWFPPCRLFEFGLGIWLIKNRKIFDFIKNVKINLNKNVIKYFSDISFPAFLIHSPLLTIISGKYSTLTTINFLAFVLSTLVLSHLIYYFNKLIHKRFTIITNV